MTNRSIDGIGLIKIEHYETYCDLCFWTMTFSASDPDAGSLRQARKNAVRAVAEHGREHVVQVLDEAYS